MAEKQAAVAEPAEEVQTDERTETRRQPPYNVVLWNDDDHTYTYVIAMMMQLFGHTFEKGYQIAKTVDTQGKAIVLTTTLEHAELKRDQIHAFGRDEDIENCAGAMYASIEPAAG
ncbi:MAG: ATP-dependent Clp protease adaptor ClpS [Thermoguttaceae bacterium]